MLNARDPKNYKDNNHKPELALAVTEFEGLCGFRPLAEIAAGLAACPELAELVGREEVAALADIAKAEAGAAAAGAEGRERLRRAFGALMRVSEDRVGAAAHRLVTRLRGADADSLTDAERLVLRADAFFPRDVGLFNIFMLNYVRLQPGQAVFLGPNVPHAYLRGDCVEVMATSDNVVRAGFTGKHKDVGTLVDMLTYEAGPVAVMDGVPEAGGARGGAEVRAYQPDGAAFPEFALRRVLLPPGAQADLGVSCGPRVVLCLDGRAAAVATLEGPPEGADGAGAARRTVPLGRGPAVLVAAGARLVLDALPAAGPDAAAGPGPALIFVASVHGSFE